MKLVEGISYLVAQFAGGIVGAYLLYWMFTTSPLYHKRIQGLGTDGYGKQSHLFVSQGGAFLIEVVLTAIFVMVVLFATHKAAIQGAAGVAIGFGLVIVHLIGIPLTGTSVNPARSLGPALVVGGTALSQVWLFIVAPLVGAIVAAIIHLVIADRSEDVVDRRSSSWPDGRPWAGRLRPAALPLRSGPWTSPTHSHSPGTASKASWPPSAPTAGRSCRTSCSCPATATR